MIGREWGDNWKINRRQVGDTLESGDSSVTHGRQGFVKAWTSRGKRERSGKQQKCTWRGTLAPATSRWPGIAGAGADTGAMAILYAMDQHWPGLPNSWDTVPRKAVASKTIYVCYASIN